MSRLLGSRLAACPAIVILLAGILWAGRVEAQAAEFEFDRGPDALLLALTLRHDMIAEEDATPLVRIYGDGRVLVHYPVYMRKGGDYSLQLSASELDSLLTSLAGNGLFTLDTADLKEDVNAAKAGKASKSPRQVVAESQDTTTTIIDVQLSGFRPAGAEAASPLKSVKSRVVWRQLQSDLEAHPEIEGLKNLAAAEQALKALAERSDLKRTIN